MTACPLMLLAPLRWALRIAMLVVTVIVLYFAVTLVQVWLTSRQYDPHPAGAILVMGAAQDDCVPTLDLSARLDQALTLYHQGYAHLIMLTGGKQPGDKCTEAQSGAMYLEARGVPERTFCRRAATTATRTSRTRSRRCWPTTPGSSSSPPTRSTRTAPWPSPRPLA